MKKFIYQSYHLTFLRQGYPLMSVADLTRGFNRVFGLNKTEQQVKAALSNHKIHCGRPTGNRKGSYRLFSKDETGWISENYKLMAIPDLTIAFNDHFNQDKTEQQLKSFVHNHGINSGRTGCFDKGHKPWNHGTKGQGLTGPNKGSFKKGQVPPNRKPIGSERIDSKDGYIHIKVAEQNPYTGFPTRYKLKHHHVWEQHHGPIPKGMVVSFIDGDKLNCSVENLELLTKAENAYLNKHGLRDVPAEMIPTARTMAKLATKTHQLERESA